MFDSVIVRTSDEETAIAVAHDLQERFQPQLLHEGDDWHVWVESAGSEELPDLLRMLYDRLRAPEPSIEVLINGENYRPARET